MRTCLDSEHGVVELHGPERQHASKQVSSSYIQIIEDSHSRISTRISAIRVEQIDSR